MPYAMQSDFESKGMPSHLMLALRSVTEAVGRSWLAAVSHTLKTYENFRDAFVQTFMNKHIVISQMSGL
jgi:phage gp29-like protein